jgi:hypothetical protein
MATEGAARERRQILVQLGTSALVGVIALMVLLQADSEQGVLFWVLLAFVVLSAGEVVWFLARYLRHSRERERLN